MVVSALLAAAAMATAAPPPARACPAEGAMEVSDKRPALLLRPQDRRGDSGAQTLGSMPKADLQLTVMRSIGGCAVSTVIREDVQGDGRFAKPR